MCPADDFDDEIRSQIRNALESWEPSDVDKWNATSWANLVSIVTGAGAVDIGHVMDVTRADRDLAAELLRKALEAAAVRRRDGLLGRIREKLGAAPPDPIAFYRDRIAALPPKPARKLVSDINGVPFYEGTEDPARLERHEVLAALVLERHERDPDTTPSQEEVARMVGSVGIRTGWES